MTTPLNYPAVGKRVWTERGFQDHGPLEGPKTSVPPGTLGEITATERPYYTMDMLLYTVHWQSRQTTKHYFNHLFCIGPFESLPAFLASLRSARNARLVKGPRGGFREFTAEILVDGAFLPIRYDKDLGSQFRQFVQPVLQEAGVSITTSLA